jgi:predicted glycosyltransferase
MAVYPTSLPRSGREAVTQLGGPSMPQSLAQTCVHTATQEEHQEAETFQNEFRRLLKKYKIEYDERYVWDACLV